MKVGTYRPRMAKGRGSALLRAVPYEYRADYCRCVGLGYPMILSKARMANARGARVAWPYGQADLRDRLNRPDPGNLWWRCVMRGKLGMVPKVREADHG